MLFTLVRLLMELFAPAPRKPDPLERLPPEIMHDVLALLDDGTLQR